MQRRPPNQARAKNHIFFGSAEVGIANALLYTLVRNCRVHDIDPEIYLAEAVRRMSENPTDDEAAALTPSELAPLLRPESINDANAVSNYTTLTAYLTVRYANLSFVVHPTTLPAPLGER